jgi:hypothetical protein
LCEAEDGLTRVGYEVFTRLPQLFDAYPAKRGRPPRLGVPQHHVAALLGGGVDDTPAAQQRERPTSEVRQHPLGNGVVVADDVQLRHAEVGEDEAVGMADAHAPHRIPVLLRGIGLRSRLWGARRSWRA